MRYKLIACEVLFREVCYCASLCDNIVDVDFIQKGLHDIGAEKMSDKLQQHIDGIDVSKYDAILLCYGLCNNGILNLHAEIPIVIPRAHDCITLLLGSKERYREYFDANPGTYFKSSGWIERGASSGDSDDNVMNQLGLNKTYEDYVEIYGEDNAEYIMEMLGDWSTKYTKMTYINTKLGNVESDRAESQRGASEKQWTYEEIDGDTRLIMKLLNGKWDDGEFLIIPRGNKITASNDENIVTYK